MAAHEGDRTTKFDVVSIEEQEEDEEEDEEEETESAVAEIKHLVIHSNSFVEFEPWARTYFKLCVWATEWPEEWYIEDDGEWEDTEIYVQVARGHDGRLFLQDSTRGLEIGSVELNYDALNTMPVHRHACSLKMEYLGLAHPVEDWRTNDYNQREAHHNRVLQLLWEWLWHVKRHLGLTFELRRIHFEDAVRTQPLGDGKSIGDSSHDDPWLRLSVAPRELRQREDGRRVARRLDPSHMHAWSARAAGNGASLSPYCM